MRRLLAAVMVVAVLVAGVGHAQDDALDDDLVADLVADLGSAQTHVREQARTELVKLGVGVVPALREALRSPRPLVQREAATTLGLLGPAARDAAKDLEDLAGSDDPLLKAAAAEALRRVNPGAAGPEEPDRPADPLAGAGLDQLIEAVGSEDKTLVIRAIRALARWSADRQRAVDVLTPLLRDENERIVRETLYALSAHGPAASSASAEIIDVLERRSAAPVRFAAYDALVGVSTDGIDVVLERLAGLHASRSDEKHIRPWLGGVLWELGEPAVLPAVDALAHEDKNRRAAGAEALGYLAPASSTAIPALVGALSDKSGVVRRQAATALGSLGAVHVNDISPALLETVGNAKSRAQLEAVGALGRIALDAANRPIRPARAAPDVRKSIDAGLAWLVAHQDSDDGKWDGDGFHRHCPERDKCTGTGQAQHDVGLTALAALALVQSGSRGRMGDQEDPRGRHLRAALRHLMSRQDSRGPIAMGAGNHWIYGHAIATLALCETWARTGHPLYGDAAQRALDLIADARNPGAAWRYGIRPGDNDTSVGGWMIAALKAGQRSGLRVDRECYAGALRYLETVTDMETGQAGYQPHVRHVARTSEALAKFPEDKSEAMTASALLQRLLLGVDPRRDPLAKKAVDRCMAIRPLWNTETGHIDVYYWYTGTLALHHVGGESWRKWKGTLKSALLPAQRMDGSAAGSWDPVGAWGVTGGRVYSTSMAVLCLLAHNDHVRSNDRSSAIPPRIHKIVSELEKMSQRDDVHETLRAAATDAVAAFRKY